MKRTKPDYSAVQKEIEIQVADLLATHMPEIAASHMNDEEQKLTMSLSIRLEPPKDLDGILIETALKFVKGRVKETRTGIVNRSQKPLFSDQDDDDDDYIEDPRD